MVRRKDLSIVMHVTFCGPKIYGHMSCISYLQEGKSTDISICLPSCNLTHVTSAAFACLTNQTLLRLLSRHSICSPASNLTHVPVCRPCTAICRQRNVQMMVTCLDLSLQGNTMHGLHWTPDHIVFSLATMALFDPSRRKMAKLGVYAHLTAAIDRVSPRVFALWRNDAFCLEPSRRQTARRPCAVASLILPCASLSPSTHRYHPTDASLLLPCASL